MQRAADPGAVTDCRRDDGNRAEQRRDYAAFEQSGIDAGEDPAFDTTQQQITTRRAQIHREILEVSSEAEQYGRELEQQRRGFEEITAEIQAFQDLISVNEQNIAEFQRQLDEKQENCGSVRLHITENPPDWSR